MLALHYRRFGQTTPDKYPQHDSMLLLDSIAC